MNDAASGIGLAIADGVARLTIDRPLKKNAVTHAMWRAIARSVGNLAHDSSVRVLIVSGAGNDFCAGADIGEFDAVRGQADAARDYERANSNAFAAVRDAPFPTLAAIRGICFGGGFGIAAACDLRIATADARFSVPAGRLGLAYPVDAMADIVHACGPQLAKYLTFSAAPVTAELALERGFLLEVVAPDALDARCLEIARAIAANAPLSVSAAKAAIRACLTRQPADADEATRLGTATFDSADYAEGRAAFRERRAPNFQGR